MPKPLVTVRTSAGMTGKFAGPAMEKAVKQVVKDELAPQVIRAYNKMVANWSAESKPGFKANVQKSPRAGAGVVMTIRVTGTDIQKGRWLMVDTEGRRGGAIIKPKPFFLKAPPAGSGVAGEELAKPIPVFKRRKFVEGKDTGEFTTFTEEERNPALHFQRRWSRTGPGGTFGERGGSEGSYGSWITRSEVKQGAVKPRHLTRNNIMTALRGKFSPVGNIITQSVGEAGRKGFDRSRERQRRRLVKIGK